VRTIKRLVREGNLSALRLNAKLVRIRLSEILRVEAQATTTGPTEQQKELIVSMHKGLAASRAAKKAAKAEVTK